MRRPPLRLLCSCLAAALLVAGVAPARASAATGGYRAIIVHAACETPTVFQGGLAAFPDVAGVDTFEACDGTPSAQQIAGFVDGSGVVVQYAYDTWLAGPEGPRGPRGRFETGGYEPSRGTAARTSAKVRLVRKSG